MAGAQIVSEHFTGGRKKTKGPHVQLPDLPSLPQGADSSDELEEENDTKRPRSTSTTPEANLSGPGIHLTMTGLWELTQRGPLLKKGGVREVDAVDSQTNKFLKGSIPRIDSDSGVGGPGVGKARGDLEALAS